MAYADVLTYLNYTADPTAGPAHGLVQVQHSVFETSDRSVETNVGRIRRVRAIKPKKEKKTPVVVCPGRRTCCTGSRTKWSSASNGSSTIYDGNYGTFAFRPASCDIGFQRSGEPSATRQNWFVWQPLVVDDCDMWRYCDARRSRASRARTLRERRAATSSSKTFLASQCRSATTDNNCGNRIAFRMFLTSANRSFFNLPYTLFTIVLSE